MRLRLCFTLFLLSGNLFVNAHAQKDSLQTVKSFARVDSLIAKQAFGQAIDALQTLVNAGKSANDRHTIANAYRQTGNVYLMQRNFDQALQHYFLSLKHYNNKTDIVELAKLYSNMGTLYSMLKELPKARGYYLKSLALNLQANTDRLKTTVNLAGVYAELKEKNNAVHTFNQGIQLAKALHHAALEAVLRTNLSNYYIGEKDWENAISSARASLKIRDSLQQPASVITLNNLGYALVQTGELKAGINYYLKALKTANLQEKKQLFFNLYHANKASGKLAAALESMEKYEQVKDTIAGLNYEQKVAELTAKYESVQQKTQILNLERENILQKKQLRQQLFLILAAVLIVALAAGLVFTRFRHYKVKNALEKSQVKRQLLLLQLNPHFIFNALQSVQRFIHLRDQQQSMEYLSSFSKLIRLVLENSDKDLIPLDEEIEILDNYLRLQNLNTSKGFSYEIIVDEQLEPENTEIPAMLLQPFVENAVLHGVRDLANGKIKIAFKQNTDGLHIIIADNGQGNAQLHDQTSNKLHRSMGIDILKQRIIELNKANPQHITLNIGSQQDPEYPGTFVHFQISS
jgi:tetratricopeptide (TPR) repeat protein/two-component sensor histidine kinase